MKSILFFILVMLATFSLAQKRMQSISSTSFNDGIAYSYDSTAFSYGSANGYLASNKPVFGFSEENLNYGFQFNNFELLADSYSFFAGSPSPITQLSQTTNSFSGNQLIEKNDGTYKVQYFYDINNKLHLYKRFLFSGTWVIQDSIVYTYNNANQVVLINNYNDQNQINLHINYIDSIEYDPIDGKILVHKNYYFDPDSNQLIPAYRREFLYSASNQIDYVDLYVYSTITDGIEWNNRTIYNFLNTVPSSVKTYEVSNGALQIMPSFEIYYTHNQDNNLSEALYIFSGDTAFISNYSYVDINFLAQMDGLFVNDPSNPVVNSEIRYNYETTLHLEQLVSIESLLFPNPAKEKLEVQVDGEILSIEVFNLQGQLLIQQKAKIIDVNELSSGTYILKGKSSEGTFKEKFIKE